MTTYLVAVLAAVLTSVVIAHRRDTAQRVLASGTTAVASGVEVAADTAGQLASFARRQAMCAAAELGSGMSAVRRASGALALAALAVFMVRAEYEVLRVTLVALFAPTTVPLPDGTFGAVGGAEGVQIAEYSAIVLVVLIFLVGHLYLNARRPVESADGLPGDRDRKLVRGLSASVLVVLAIAMILLGMFRAEALSRHVDPESTFAVPALEFLGPTVPVLFMLAGVAASWGLPIAVDVVWLLLMGAVAVVAEPVERLLTAVVGIIDGGIAAIIAEVIDIVAEIGRGSWNAGHRLKLTTTTIPAFGARPSREPGSSRQPESREDTGKRPLVVAGRWECVGPLPGADRGGHGTLWLAHDRSREHGVVAVKLMAPDAPGETHGRRVRRAFHREHLNTVSSDHVVPVLAIGDDHDGSGWLYVVTPYYRNGSLRRYYESLRDLPTLGWCVDRVREVLAGLRDCAAAGVVHHDVKPANILIDDGLRARIGDFGLAGATGPGDVQLTAAGHGTLYFTAPEQWELRTEAEASLSDVYSVGAVLYYLLWGMPPFAHEQQVEHVKDADVIRTLVCNPGRAPERLDRLDHRLAAAAPVVTLVARWLSYDAHSRVPDSPPDEVLTLSLAELDHAFRLLDDDTKALRVGVARRTD